MANSEGAGPKVLARQLSAIEDRCSALCKGAGQGAGNKVPFTYGGTNASVKDEQREGN
jgi:hypothetical protein